MFLIRDCFLHWIKLEKCKIILMHMKREEHTTGVITMVFPQYALFGSKLKNNFSILEINCKQFCQSVYSS